MPNLIPKLKYAFLGMSLENGTKTVAYLNIFTYSTMASIFIINALLEPIPHDETTEVTEDLIYPESWAIGKNIKATFFLESSTILQLVFSSFLLYGATVRQSKLLFSWVLLQTGLIFHSQLTVILNFILLFAVHWGFYHVLSFIFQEVLTIGTMVDEISPGAVLNSIFLGIPHRKMGG